MLVPHFKEIYYDPGWLFSVFEICFCHKYGFNDDLRPINDDDTKFE